MEREIFRVLPYILVGMFGMGVLLFLLSMIQLRRRRTGAYWRLRRQAGDLGGRLFILSVFLLIASLVSTLVGGIAFLIVQPDMDGVISGPEDLYGIILPTASAQTTIVDVAAAQGQETSTEAALPTETPTLAPATATLVPPTSTALPTTATTVVLPPTNTPRPTDIPAPTAAATATPDFAALLGLTPIFNTTPRPPNADFQMTIESASSIYATSSIPAPVSQYDAGLKRIYLYISFERMEDGVAWSRVLYLNGTPIQGSTVLWNQGAAGRGSFFFGSATGYAAGNYEVRLFVGDQEASRFSFVVINSVSQTAVE